MSASPLPAGFGDLEPWIAWALPSERERMAKRVASPMDEIIAFHAAMSARLEAIVHYLNQFPYADLAPDARRLCDMALSLVEVSSLVEMYKDPANLYMVDSSRFVAIE